MQLHLTVKSARNFPKDLANWFDAVLAVAGLTDFFLSMSLPDTSTSQSSLGRCELWVPFAERAGQSGLASSYNKWKIAEAWINFTLSLSSALPSQPPKSLDLS